MPSFDGLQTNRREAQSVARRQSMSDQQAKLGVFGQFFHKYVCDCASNVPIRPVTDKAFHSTFGKNTK